MQRSKKRHSDDDESLPVLERAANLITLADPGVRGSLALALRDSLTVDDDHKAYKVLGSAKIARLYNVPVEMQWQNLVLLDRDAAVSFLSDIGFRISPANFNRRFTGPAYKRLFRRVVSVVGNRHVFTFAEVMHLANCPQRVEFPKQLRSYL